MPFVPRRQGGSPIRSAEAQDALCLRVIKPVLAPLRDVAAEIMKAEEVRLEAHDFPVGTGSMVQCRQPLGLERGLVKHEIHIVAREVAGLGRVDVASGKLGDSVCARRPGRVPGCRFFGSRPIPRPDSIHDPWGRLVLLLFLFSHAQKPCRAFQETAVTELFGKGCVARSSHGTHLFAKDAYILPSLGRNFS